MRSWARAVIVAVAVTCGGCWSGEPGSLAAGGGGSSGAATESNPARAADTNPFAPTWMRVHPLTHVRAGPDGEPEIVCHVELRDRWGDGCKGRGSLVVRVFGPRDGSLAAEGEVSRWDVDLNNLEQNAMLFDPATRTYRMVLTGPPKWMTSLIRGGSGEAPKGRVVVQASLTSAESGTLSDELQLRR